MFLPWIKNEGIFLISPNGQQLLIKSDLGGGDFKLRLEDLKTRELIGGYEGGCPLLITWRPDMAKYNNAAEGVGVKPRSIESLEPAGLLVPLTFDRRRQPFTSMIAASNADVFGALRGMSEWAF